MLFVPAALDGSRPWRSQNVVYVAEHEQMLMFCNIYNKIWRQRPRLVSYAIVMVIGIKHTARFFCNIK
ncbi:hypothetical protein KDK_16410 [Dictyobacter kobayashii]|uniref:Uncharacterized protein n=1 Tax=Dictyobacter kobayashii TaxID=2014872 RepID=A0A402AFG0_9CHLR|nr:hypothetical protein KDK_16410 [Dictyobacter kobayashii]